MDTMQQIGFYTLSDERCKTVSASSRLQRCELILTGRCNFRCPYCRSVGGNDLPLSQALATVNLWCDHGLKNIRFSGGEPTLYGGLPVLVDLAKSRGVERIAISTNGASAKERYDDLLNRGVNDISISLDAADSITGDMMAGNRRGAWKKVVQNIEYLSKKTYVTVGVVLTDTNKEQAETIINFADSLGVHDIRVIPAAQHGKKLPVLSLDASILDKYPILKYRVQNIQCEKPVRGFSSDSPKRCGLVLDDMAVMGDKHYPCIIYMRENGEPIGTVGDNMRAEREHWYMTHDVAKDPICTGNCLDVCQAHNEKVESFR